MLDLGEAVVGDDGDDEIGLGLAGGGDEGAERAVQLLQDRVRLVGAGTGQSQDEIFERTAFRPDLGDPQPGNMSPLYRGQLLVHGLGFSPDREVLRELAKR